MTNKTLKCSRKHEYKTVISDLSDVAIKLYCYDLVYTRPNSSMISLLPGLFICLFFFSNLFKLQFDVG